jgi:hypothetical protein
MSFKVLDGCLQLVEETPWWLQANNQSCSYLVHLVCIQKQTHFNEYVKFSLQKILAFNVLEQNFQLFHHDDNH